MAGPKMGPRPKDFDEELIKKAPTFKKWLKLEPGKDLTYACRQFTKGGVDDEERLMRRIMIARRNNLKDHAVLKKARATVKRVVVRRGQRSISRSRVVVVEKGGGAHNVVRQTETEAVSTLEGAHDSQMTVSPPLPATLPANKRRRVAGALVPTDEEIQMQMDVPAVESTRSYRRWLALDDGKFFTYNQTYTKGKGDHDWLLKKNIWRRMRYRRENQIKVIEMNNGVIGGNGNWPSTNYANANRAGVHDPTATDSQGRGLVSKAVADAAAAAAAQVEKFEPGIDADAVAALGANDPIVSSALDAAAQLAAVAVADAPAADVDPKDEDECYDVDGMKEVEVIPI